MSPNPSIPPKFNSEFTPEKLWLEDDPASFWDGIFSGAIAVKLPGVDLKKKRPKGP